NSSPVLKALDPFEHDRQAPLRRLREFSLVALPPVVRCHPSDAALAATFGMDNERYWSCTKPASSEPRRRRRVYCGLLSNGLTNLRPLGPVPLTCRMVSSSISM